MAYRAPKRFYSPNLRQHSFRLHMNRDIRRQHLPLLAGLLVTLAAAPTFGSLVTGSTQVITKTLIAGSSDPTFSFSFDIGPYSGSVNLSAVENTDGSYTAESGSGMLYTAQPSGAPIATEISLVPDDSTAPFIKSNEIAANFNGDNLSYDNLLFPGQSPTLDINGLMFDRGPHTGSGELLLNILGQPRWQLFSI